MTLIEFKQDARLTREVLILGDSEVSVELRCRGFSKKKVTYGLSKLQPDYKLRKKWLPGLVVGPIIVAGIIFMAGQIYWVPLVVSWCLWVFAIVLCAMAIRDLRPVETVVFCGEHGEEALTVYQPIRWPNEKDHRYAERIKEYEEFYRELQRRVLSEKQNLPE